MLSNGKLESPTVLTVGLEQDIEKTINDLLSSTTVTSLSMDPEQLLENLEVTPCMVISGSPKEQLTANELAQTLRMQYQDVPIFLCCAARAGFERKDFIHNGFSDAFLMPTDLINLRTAISESLSKATNGAIRVFRPVKLVDMTAGNHLDFELSVFLPANKKYVKFLNAGDELDAERVEKIKKSKTQNVFVPAEQMKNFYTYSAKQLKSMGSSSTMSATEKKEKMASAVRDLISGLFSDQAASFASGQAVIRDCNEIVKAYIIDGTQNDWYSRIQSVLGDRSGTYSHASNVSTLAALFSMGLGIGNPEDLALAGLLHDIGIADLPIEIQALEPSEMHPGQIREYEKHPELSVALIKSRKISVNETVTKAILQHHELYNGQGFPKGLYGDRICKEAQVLAIADEFDRLTALKDGVPLMTPTQAVQYLRNTQTNNPSRIHYSPELLNRLLSLFPPVN